MQDPDMSLKNLCISLTGGKSQKDELDASIRAIERMQSTMEENEAQNKITRLQEKKKTSF